MAYTGGDLKPQLHHTYSGSAGGEWPSLEARAEHIADASSGLVRGGTLWTKIYERALDHLRVVVKIK